MTMSVSNGDARAAVTDVNNYVELLHNDYRELEYDVKNIHLHHRLRPTSNYSDLPTTSHLPTSSPQLPLTSHSSNFPQSASPPRQKGTSWTIIEHMLFLRGIEIYGRGDWRGISRNLLTTRLPTQVASHAQKFFNRQSEGRVKKRKRRSIHDLTSVAKALTHLRTHYPPQIHAQAMSALQTIQSIHTPSTPPNHYPLNHTFPPVNEMGPPTQPYLSRDMDTSRSSNPQLLDTWLDASLLDMSCLDPYYDATTLLPGGPSKQEYEYEYMCSRNSNTNTTHMHAPVPGPHYIPGQSHTPLNQPSIPNNDTVNGFPPILPKPTNFL